MRQLLLDLPKGADFSAAAWQPTSGTTQAYNALLNSDIGCLGIYGPEGAGKTHLLVMASQKNANLLVVDELETLDPAAQELLFHEFNSRKGQHIVLASRKPVAQLSLLPDLKSRLLTGIHIEVSLPTETELRTLLSTWATTRQLTLPEAVVNYLLTRAERNPKNLLTLVTMLDDLSLEEKRAITVPLAKRVLESASS